MKKYVRPLPFVIALVALVYGSIVLRGPRGLSDLAEKRALARNLESQNAEIERLNKEKAEHVKKLGSDRSTLEVEIRKRLGMKKENETLFKDSNPMPADSAGAGTPAPTLADH
jgi:cell division protein FtsB